MHEDDYDHDRDSEERLRWQLRALRTDAPPVADLWPGIAGRIARSQSRGPRRPGFAWLAAAASLLLAFAVGWQLRPLAQGPAQASLVQREADAMTREYAAAVRRMQASAPAAQDDPALRELDHSARQIRAALRRDPDAGFLLQRLRHTYEKRLALTQRALLG